MEYKDFNIRIMSKRDDGYEVSVDSPAGSANDVIKLPFEIEDALKRIREIGGVVRSGNGDGATREVAFEAEDVVTPAEFGAELYQALFSGTVGKMYNRSYAALMENPDVGLRIKLHMNLDDPGVSELAQIPWEYIYEADTMEYLTLSRQTPIVRYIEVQRGMSTHQLQGDLRILVVMSSPEGEAALDLEKERRLIKETWANEENVKVDFLEHPTPESLLTALTENRYHVLHYMGHGAYDAKTGAGALILEDNNRQPLMIDPQTLGAYLRDAPTVRLVFLNACDTARSANDEPFAGVANRLVMAGVPAVVAMQFPITDAAAIDFSRAFYSRLVAGFPVDEATAQGRKAILAGSAGTMEWGTPVLYMRAPDGQLFDAPDVVTEPAPIPVPTPQPGEGPVDPTPAPSGPIGGSGSTIKLIGGIGAAAVLAVLAIFVVPKLLDTGPDFEWYPEDAAFDVGVAETIQLRIREEDGSFDYFDDGYEIELRPVSDTMIVQRTDEEQMWEWMVTVEDLGFDGSEPAFEGAVELEARIREVASGEIAKILEAEFPVAIEEAQLAEYNAAVDALESEDALLPTMVSAYRAAYADAGGDIMSPSMRAKIDAAMSDVIDGLHAAATAAADDQSMVIGERIAAIEAWSGTIENISEHHDAAIDEGLVASHETLTTRAAVLQDVIICTTMGGCDTSVATARTTDEIYVSTVPGDAERLSCLWTGPQEKDCVLNENSWRGLNLEDTYTLEIRNAQNDLLSSQTIDIRN